MGAKFRIAGHYDADAASKASALRGFSKGVTQQQFKDDADINRIVARFVKTGLAPVNSRPPLPGDYLAITDFHTAMQAVRQGEEAFAALPANIRLRFHNDPGRFVDWVLDENNKAEAESLGLSVPKKQAEPVDNSPKEPPKSGEHS